jgi:HlyD family secretion protein
VSTADARLPEPGPVAAPAPELPPPPTRGRRGTRIVVALAVALVAAFAYGRYRSDAGDAAARWVTAPVDRGPIEQTVSATGTVNPVKTVQVGTYVSGPILAIDVDFNSPVKQGQRVAKIDPRRSP